MIQTMDHFKWGEGAPGSSLPRLRLSLGLLPSSPVEGALIYINNCVQLEEEIAAQRSSISPVSGLSIGLRNLRQALLCSLFVTKSPLTTLP